MSSSIPYFPFPCYFFHIYSVEFLGISMDFQRYTLVYKSGSVNSYSCAHISISESTLPRTSTLQRDYQSRLNPLQYKLIEYCRNYQSRLNLDPNSDYSSGLNSFYTYSSGGLYQDRITRPGQILFTVNSFSEIHRNFLLFN